MSSESSRSLSKRRSKSNERVENHKIFVTNLDGTVKA